MSAIDLTDVLGVTSALVDIDSTTGSEADVVRWVATRLSDAGYEVVEQVVDGPRRNIFAGVGKADVVLSTHLDCVPPFFPSRREGDTLFGRGSCDAKGAAASQIAAVENLRRDGITNVGLLFVVGEERGSDGAKAAQKLACGSTYLINGEPTGCRLGVATRGILRVNLKASGRAAHSSYPENGESAIEKLVDALVALRKMDLPEHALMGRTHYTVGVINGGVAPNVIPASAQAEVMFRTVGDLPGLRRLVASLAPNVEVEEALEVPPVTMPSVPGFETASFPYTTDIPFLSTWGTPLLFGPGSIHVAHTDHEHVTVAELHKAVDGYVRLARYLVAQRGPALKA
ncbi:MAG: M20/M25/M40 family metallo-hydrolase [Acidobacteria bacterium]|nr:M20/M25/M40 family metallo-hydrolase [Acidobacteriota bacterium]